MKRAKRRKDLSKCKDRAVEILKAQSMERSDEWLDRISVRIANNLKSCNKDCCANPRKILHEPTRQEKQSEELFKNELKEWSRR